MAMFKSAHTYTHLIFSPVPSSSWAHLLRKAPIRFAITCVMCTFNSFNRMCEKFSIFLLALCLALPCRAVPICCTYSFSLSLRKFLVFSLSLLHQSRGVCVCVCVYRNISPLSHTKRIPLCVFMLVTFEKHVEHNNNGFVAGTNMLCPHIASCNI